MQWGVLPGLLRRPVFAKLVYADSTGRGRAMQDKAGQGKAGQGRAGKGRAGKGREG